MTNGEKARIALELHKVKREIETHGDKYTFYRDVLNEYKELTGEHEIVSTICGIFHSSGNYVLREANESTIKRTKRQPMFLCAWESSEKIRSGDYMILNGKRFEVTGKNNINEYNTICDMSLEVILYGES